MSGRRAADNIRYALVFKRLIIAWLGLMTLSAAAGADGLSLADIRGQILKAGTISGYFVQCSKQGKTRVAGNGSYIFNPGEEIRMQFYSPVQYEVAFFRDGSQQRIDNGIEQKSAHPSSIGRLMFSVIGMLPENLEKRFDYKIEGNESRFSLTLSPKASMTKLVQLVQIRGSEGRLSNIDFIFNSKRSLNLSFFAQNPAETGCI